MSRKIPYLQRRNDALEFRISVPHALRKKMGQREIVRTLKTQDRHTAAPIALLLASKAKQLFLKLHNMTDDDLIRVDYLLEVNFNELGGISGLKVDAQPHEQAAVSEAIETTIRSNAAHQRIQTIPTYAAMRADVLAPPQNVSSCTLSAAIDDFYVYYKTCSNSKGIINGENSMYGTHKKTLPMFLDVVGNKHVSHLCQEDVDGFFKLVARLPVTYKTMLKNAKVSLIELAKQEHEETLQFTTFKAGYFQTIKSFIEWGYEKKRKEGFPNLTTRSAKKEFAGARDTGAEGQRALSLPELQRLYEGAEMKSFASDPAQHHKFWLMHIGLFTGARINEICQLNPQTDILEEDGVWIFWINETEQGNAKITKSVKGHESKKVPIHKTLIELGFLQYFERVKSAGATLIFPEFEPARRTCGRASEIAEVFFRDFLRELGLRDETPYEQVTGMHALRHTLLTWGGKQTPCLVLTAITGHAQKENKLGVTGAAIGYMKAALTDPLCDRQELLNKLDYGLKFHKPA